MNLILRRFVLPGLLLFIGPFAAGQDPAGPGKAALSELERAQEKALAPPRNALDKADLEFYVRHLYLWGPHIQVDIGEFAPAPVEGFLQTTVRASYKLASQQVALYVSKDGQHVLEGRILPVAQNPFQGNIEKITTADQPSFGAPGAPVVIAVYSDFQCPYCAKEAKILRSQLVEDYPEQVRVYFRDFPLRSHNWAFDAAVCGRCIHQLDPQVFWDFHDWIFENQGSVTPQNLKDKVTAFASGKGLDVLKLASCLESRETEKVIQQSLEEGRSVGVSSTPTIFVNGRKLAGSLKWEELKQVIDYEIQYQKITGNAGDNCGCEVSLPFPSAQ